MRTLDDLRLVAAFLALGPGCSEGTEQTPGGEAFGSNGESGAEVAATDPTDGGSTTASSAGPTGPGATTGPGHADGASSGTETRCQIPQLAHAGYIPYPQAGHGQVQLGWSQHNLAELALLVTMDGAVMTDEALPPGATEFETTWGVQMSDSTSGVIAIAVELTGTCPSGEVVTTDAEYELVDPISICPLPELEFLEGNTVPFYTCAEAWANDGTGCGETGYLIGYGAKYAQKFYDQTRPLLSPTGQLWLDAVLVCLQTRLRDETYVGTSCEDIRSTGFGQHPGCYADHGACALPPSDLSLVALTIEGAEWATPEAFEQVLDLAALCGMALELEDTDAPVQARSAP